MLFTSQLAIFSIVGGAVIYLFRHYMQGSSYRSRVKLDHKTVIITGGNTGIGKQTAIDLARRGARVILACRNRDKATDAIKDIIQESGNNTNVVFRMLDLASCKSIREFAADINSNEDRVDILINNAAVFMCPYTDSEDGYEMHFATNHLGHFLLTHLLLDKLKASAPSRIVNVSSDGHFYAKIDFDDLHGRKVYKPFGAYIQSKLANVLFTCELAKRLEGTGVTVNALHPGAVDTDIPRHLTARKNIILRTLLAPFLWLLLKTSEQGAQTSIYCAIEPSLEKVSGQYFADCRQKDCAKHGCDEGVAKKLWEISEEMTGLANNH